MGETVRSVGKWRLWSIQKLCGKDKMKCFFIKSVFLDFSRSLHSVRNDIRLNNRLGKGAIRWYRIVLAWMILIVGMLVTWSFRTERREWEKSFCIDTNGTNCCKCSVVILSPVLRVAEGAVRNLWVGEISQSTLRISYRNDKSEVFSSRPLSGVEGAFLESKPWLQYPPQWRIPHRFLRALGCGFP